MSADAEPGRHAVVVPGRLYGPLAGLLAYVGQAAARRGARLETITWTPPGGRSPDELAPWVHGQVEPVVDRLGAPLLIGKSLGSFAASVAAGRDLPAVWLTPVLTAPACVAALRRATRPYLLVGGTADGLWDGPLARELTPYVCEVAGADHGMLVPGPLRDSAAALGRITTAVEEFLDDVVWPPAWRGS